jgi:hypothetical protein
VEEDASGGGDGVVLLLCGFAVSVPFARAWASHASRVLWSTGQAAAGSSWEDMACKMGRVKMFGKRLGTVTVLVDLEKLEL